MHSSESARLSAKQHRRTEKDVMKTDRALLRTSHCRDSFTLYGLCSRSAEANGISAAAYGADASLTAMRDDQSFKMNVTFILTR
jgi:hypothetical protein